MELFEVKTLREARDELLQHMGDFSPSVEEVDTGEGLGRILAEDVICERDIPDFRRSMVDGYAVRASDTMGASDKLPVFLRIIEEVDIGRVAKARLKPGTCAYVPTGAMLPEGADSCVMVEYSELFDKDSVAIYQAVAPGQAVVDIGEDYKRGTTLLKKGTKLRAQEIGAASANGMSRLRVFQPWKISIISTGDELIPPGEKLVKGKIYDINTSALSALALRHGFEVVESVTAADEEEVLREQISRAMTRSDLVVISGGSSKGKKDLSAKLIDQLSEPGVFVHGLALKPGKPTILGMDHKTKTLLIGLPGHPVAAMAVFELLPVWLKRTVEGTREEPSLPALLTQNVPGTPGRQLLLFVELSEGQNIQEAKPIFGKSGLISTITRADAYAILDLNMEGLKRGELIRAHRF